MKDLMRIGVALFLLFWPMPAQGDAIEGDVELLRLVANGYRANRDKVRTLRGAATIRFSYRDASGAIDGNEVMGSAEFVSDPSVRATRWRWQYGGADERSQQDGRENSTEFVSGMLNDRNVYRFNGRPPLADGRRAVHTLAIRHQTQDDRDINIWDESFDPFYCFGPIEIDTDLHDRLMFYYREARNPKLTPGRVERNGNLVVFSVGNEATVLNRYTFDLDKGCNMVSFVGRDEIVQDNWEFDFRAVDGIYVPNSVRRSKKITKNNVTTTFALDVKFGETAVNTLIDPAEFTVETLGINSGDYVDDHVAGIRYVYGIDEQVMHADAPIETGHLASDSPMSGTLSDGFASKVSSLPAASSGTATKEEEVGGPRFVSVTGRRNLIAVFPVMAVALALGTGLIALVFKILRGRAK